MAQLPRLLPCICKTIDEIANESCLSYHQIRQFPILKVP